VARALMLVVPALVLVELVLVLVLQPPAAQALDDGLCRTPIMGMNSWTAFGQGVTEADLLAVGSFFVSSGLRDAGYRWVNSDDGWDTRSRGADGRLQPDPAKFPDGIKGLVQKLGAMNLSFGIYTAESSVVCSGRPGSLFHEYLDAQTFADWCAASPHASGSRQLSLPLERRQPSGWLSRLWPQGGWACQK
jgi:alpha-galactosidase